MTQKRGKFLNKKNKKTKREHAFFNPEPELKDNESALKSKQIELLTQLKGFRFVIKLVLVFKKIERENKIKYDNFH